MNQTDLRSLAERTQKNARESRSRRGDRSQSRSRSARAWHQVRDHDEYKHWLEEYWILYMKWFCSADLRAVGIEELDPLGRQQAFAFIEQTLGGQHEMDTAERDCLAGRNGGLIAIVDQLTEALGKRVLKSYISWVFFELIPRGDFELRERLAKELIETYGPALFPGERLLPVWALSANLEAFIEGFVNRGIIQSPKTHHSVRTAAISNSIREDLGAWLKISPNTKPDDWIFPNEKGNKPLSHGNYWRRAIKPTLDTLKMTGVTFQALRRTCTSTLNNLGIDGKLVADQLGHTLDVSQNVYTKTGIARQQEAISQLDKSFTATPIARAS